MTTHTYTAPRIGRGPAAEGKRAALRSFQASVLTLDGDVERDIAVVLAGTAPQEFKDAFTETLDGLSSLLDADPSKT
jgi:hypothetical protein